jgi:hypothetical protein
MHRLLDPAYRAHLSSLFRQLFDWHPAHVCMLDPQGIIMEVNRAWRRFAQQNNADENVSFQGVNYVDITTQAAEQGDEFARQALTGLLDIIATGRKKFVLTYPCHSPHERRWFKMWVEPQMPETPVIIVAHQLERAEIVSMPDHVPMIDAAGSA